MCQKAWQKLNAISRITPYMDFVKRRLLVNAFFYSQSNYCQLVWMCHNQTNDIKTKWWKFITAEKSSFEDLLGKDRFVSMHYINLRTLAVQLFEVFKGLSPFVFAEAFPVRQKSQYEELLILCYALSCQNVQPWIRKFVIHRFEIVRQYTIPYERDRLY